MSREISFSKGFDRGVSGSMSSAGSFDFSTLFEDAEAKEARERGFEAGVIVAALRENEDE